MNLRVGIFFGGFSREREISFAGGRTVYDNLNKSLFDAVPVFVDSFGNFVLLDWEFIYKGSIRDFYPPVNFLPPSPHGFQVYAESLNLLTSEKQEELFHSIGRKIRPTELPDLIDFAFLCLHGPYGEDGRIQGLLEYLGIPYSGSGILSSSIGINKAIQKKMMKATGFDCPRFSSIIRAVWLTGDKKKLAGDIIGETGFPCVVKPANQGSSVGVTILQEEDMPALCTAIDNAFFIRTIKRSDWTAMSETEKPEYIRTLTDIRDGIGIPLILHRDNSSEEIYHPEELLRRLETIFLTGSETVTLESLDAESEVVVEEFISGKEFSCIVIRNEDGNPVALPPTEIRKGKELFDYRSKYLPGLSRKITPIHLPDEDISRIRKECERLYASLHFNVYARIDGFITNEGTVYLNDPNTTSGMMPSSFFFHQAAEIGLNPSQFLTYIIRTSLLERSVGMPDRPEIARLQNHLDHRLVTMRSSAGRKTRVAVIMGGYSSERHISVESGRNIYEKLSSSEKYEPVPVFLSGSDDNHELWLIPVNLMLKDNADDILEKISHFSVHPAVSGIMEECKNLTTKYAYSHLVTEPRRIQYENLSEICDAVFIALHGRPGEDGEVQRRLEKAGIPYNGSGVESSKLTINKYETNEVLRRNGFLVADHAVISQEEWNRNKSELVNEIAGRFGYPLIAKPVDDGCSSAVKKITNEKQLISFAEMIFRTAEQWDQLHAQTLNLKRNEEFPVKRQFLVEKLIGPEGANHFLEITGGLLSRMNDEGHVDLEVFEASEALSEGDVLSLEEKFLAGEGQNITPARYATDPSLRQKISEKVKEEFRRAAEVLNIEGYARIDAFVRVFSGGKTEVIFIEVNSLPGMTPATCIFHQAAIAGYKPYEFIDSIIEYGVGKSKKQLSIH